MTFMRKLLDIMNMENWEMKDSESPQNNEAFISCNVSSDTLADHITETAQLEEVARENEPNSTPIVDFSQQSQSAIEEFVDKSTPNDEDSSEQTYHSNRMIIQGLH